MVEDTISDDFWDIKDDHEFKTIERMHNEYVADRKIFEVKLNEITDLASFYSSYNNFFTKIFTIACANAFERHLCRVIPTILSQKDCNSVLFNFLSKQAFERKYHSLFSWKDKNANSFYGLFGENFKNDFRNFLDNSDFKQGEKDFLLLGYYRNQIVHQGFDLFSLNKNQNEIWELYQSALFYYAKMCENVNRHHNK